MILTALAALVGFSLGAFVVGMAKTHRDYTAFKAGYMAAMDTDLPPHMLDAEVRQAYIDAVEAQ